MRHYTRPLRDELSRHGKRSSLDLTGTVAGTQPGTFFPGRHYVLPYPQAGHVHSSTIPPAQTSIYDMSAFCQWPEQEYEPADPWFDGHQSVTPPLRVARGPFPPRPPRIQYRNSLMTPELMDQLVQDLPDPAMPDEPVPLEHAITGSPALIGYDEQEAPDVVGPDIPDQGAHPQPSASEAGAHPWYDTGLMTPEIFEQAMAPFASQQEMVEATPEPTDSFGTVDDLHAQGLQGGLESMLEMPIPDPFAMQQQQFDEQMQYMDPFMMPGFGPFGPMPGM